MEIVVRYEVWPKAYRMLCADPGAGTPLAESAPAKANRRDAWKFFHADVLLTAGDAAAVSYLKSGVPIALLERKHLGNPQDLCLKRMTSQMRSAGGFALFGEDRLEQEDPTPISSF